MGLFSSNNRSNEWGKRAKTSTADARKAARRAMGAAARLATGTSDDPAADRAMQRQHDADRRVAEANARDFTTMATKPPWWKR